MRRHEQSSNNHEKSTEKEATDKSQEKLRQEIHGRHPHLRENHDQPRDQTRDTQPSLPSLEIAMTQDQRPCRADGSKQTVEYGDDGQPVRYTSFNNEVFNKQTDGQGNEVWRSESNVVQPEGVQLKFNGDGSTEMTDIATGITRHTDSEGVETTTYPGGGKTTRTTHGTTETIIIDSTNRRERSMKIVDDRLMSYTDGDGATYTAAVSRDEYGVACTDEEGNPYLLKDENGKLLYEKIDSEGIAVSGRFTISADRSGNVVVRDIDKPDSPQYARRELNNGTIITSDSSNSERVTIDAAGQELQRGTPEAMAAEESPLIAETPPGVSLQENCQQAQAHTHWFGPDAFWFKDQVKPGAPWDYKTRGPEYMHHPEYADFGNYNYGYTGRAMGFSESELKQLAGSVQENPRPEWGSPGIGWGIFRVPGTGSQSNGDDPHDQVAIQQGIDAHERAA